MWPPEAFCWLGDCNGCYRFSAKVSWALQLNRDSARCHGAWVGGRIISRRGFPFIFFFFFAFLHTFLSLCASLSLPDPRDSPFDSFRSLGRNGVHIFSCVSESIHVCVDEHRARQVSEKGFFPLTRLDRLREKKMHVVVWEQAAGRLFIHRFLNALFSSLARVPVVCCFACMLNSSAYLRWGALDLFRVFLPTCLLLPLCFCYCLLFSHLEECFFFFFTAQTLHFLCNFFWRYFRLIQSASFALLKNRIF